jgi:hypothetical protein
MTLVHFVGQLGERLVGRVLSGFSKLKEAIGWGSSASILANRRESEKATLLTSATGTPVDRLPFLARRCFT